MSYESCAKHEGQEATNGCDKCAAEERELRMVDLDNFLASWFGGSGERASTVLFLEKIKEAGFVVVDSDDRDLRL